MKHHTHIGVYGVVLNSSKQILVVRKTRGPYEGKLDLPGGGIESGEDKFTCLQREIKEETGIVVGSAKFIRQVANNSEYVNSDGVPEALKHIGSLYWVTDYSDSAFNAKIVEEDVSGAVWLDLRETEPTQLSPFALIAVEQIKYGILNGADEGFLGG